jgi:hypothetical protein
VYSNQQPRTELPEIMDQDIEAWRRVHRKLTLALMQSRDNIAAELTKRRYLLEEMNRCKMQNNTQKPSTPGTSGGAKAKKRASVTKKVPPPKKEKVPAASDAAFKAVSKMPQPMAEPLANTSIGTSQRFKTPGMFYESTVASNTAPLMGIGNDVVASSQNDGDRSMLGGGAAGAYFNRADALQPNLQFAPRQMGQMFYSSSPYGMYGNMATPEQMGLALQMLHSNATMLQQMNHSNSTIDGESDSDA